MDYLLIRKRKLETNVFFLTPQQIYHMTMYSECKTFPILIQFSIALHFTRVD